MTTQSTPRPDFPAGRGPAHHKDHTTMTLTSPDPITTDTSPATTRVIGLDLSLTRVGVAGSGPAGAWTDSIRVRGDGHLRLRRIREAVGEFCDSAALVVVEGPSYGSAAGQRGHHERAGLWWLITHGLWMRNIPVAVVPPATLKRYATGRGQADKDTVLLAVARRYPHVAVDNNDEADALILLAMGLDHLGHPLADLPAGHRVALGAVTWPEVMTP